MTGPIELLVSRGDLRSHGAATAASESAVTTA
jgi:hypothetical protein